MAAAAAAAFERLHSTTPSHLDQANLVNNFNSLAATDKYHSVVPRRVYQSSRVTLEKSEHVSGMKTTNSTWIRNAQQEQLQ